MANPITLYVRRSPSGKTEFRNELHKRGKFGWRPVTLRWVECVYDICGNDRNPGMAADLWEEVSTGRKAVVFQGAWAHYLPRTHQGTRIPTWIFLDEYPTVSFEDGGDVLWWMEKNFVTGQVLPAKVYPARPIMTEPNAQPGLPFVGRGDSLTCLRLTRPEMTALNQLVSKAPDGVQTRDGFLRFTKLCRHRFDSDIHYLVYRDGKPWFVTGKYDLVLQLFWKHVRGAKGLRAAA